MHLFQPILGAAPPELNLNRLQSRVISMNFFPPLPGVCQYLSMSMFMDASALAMWAMLGLKCSSHFRFPYLSTSPAEFWNSRWNIPVSQAFRGIIYDPIIEGKWIKQDESEDAAKKESPKTRKARGKMTTTGTTTSKKVKEKDTVGRLSRRAIAALLVFLASGLMHEAMFHSLTGRFTPSLLWLKYFVYWGVIVVAEGVLKRPLQQVGIVLPKWVGMLGTLLAFNWLTGKMWWVPAEQAGMPETAMKHVNEVWDAVKGCGEVYFDVFKLQEAED